MCGEKVPELHKDGAVHGSPPRVRGEVFSGCQRERFPRITPACAGRRMGYRWRCLSGRDHPRVCGEKRVCGSARPRCRGSPPRVRGEDDRAAVPHRDVGITPACAGRRQRFPLFRATAQDHPRVCGEKFIMAKPRKPRDGSPPRVRGEAPESDAAAIPGRITPACAGRSQLHDVTSFISEDHPRVCGEKCSTIGWKSFCAGSPPRVRGEGQV